MLSLVLVLRSFRIVTHSAPLRNFLSSSVVIPVKYKHITLHCVHRLARHIAASNTGRQFPTPYFNTEHFSD